MHGRTDATSLGIKPSSNEIVPKHLDLELSPQASCMIHQRPPDPGSLESRIHENGTHLVPEE